jgi:hypothetical protein
VETDNSQKKAAGFTKTLLNGEVKEVYIILLLANKQQMQHYFNNSYLPRFMTIPVQEKDA